MKTKKQSPKHRPAARPLETITLKLPETRAALLRACAAHAGLTPEEFATESLIGALVAGVEGMSLDLRQAHA
jgi:hypothetical protein